MMRLRLHNGRSWPAAVARGLVLATLGGGWASVPSHADGVVAAVQVTVATVVVADATPEDAEKAGPPPKPVFAPEVEKKFTAVLTKATELKRKDWQQKMGKVIDKMAKSTGLDEPGRKALETSSREAVELCLPAWKEGWERIVRMEVKQASDEVLDSISGALDAAEGMGQMEDGVETPVLPQDHSTWTAAVKRILTPEQLATWEKVTAEEKRKLNAEIGDRLTAGLDISREAMQQTLLAKSAEISRTLNLPKERTDEIKALVKSAVEESMTKMRAREEKIFAAMEEETRRQYFKNRGLYLSPIAGELPQSLPTWKMGLARLLSGEEQERLKADAREHEARRIPALAHLMLAEFDKKVALTANQRERLEPVFQGMAAKNAGVMSDQTGGEGAYQVDVQGALANGLKSVETEVQAILEPVQWQHWLEAAKAGGERRDRFARQMAPKQPEEKVSAPPEPEEYERAISEYLDEKARKVRRQALAECLLRAEDAGRAAGLPAEKVERLKTVARGAVEESLSNWKVNTTQTVRSFAGDTTARFIRRRLEGLEGYSFLNRINPAPETQALWLNAFKTDLDAGQAAAAEKAVKDREAFMTQSIAGFVVAMFDIVQPITAEQQAKMEPAVAGIIKEYQPDMANYFSGSNSVEWYLLSYSIFMPVAGVPEADLKNILGPERFQLWMKSPQFEAAMSYWPGIRDNHDERVKAGQKSN